MAIYVNILCHLSQHTLSFKPSQMIYEMAQLVVDYSFVRCSNSFL